MDLMTEGEVTKQKRLSGGYHDWYRHPVIDQEMLKKYYGKKVKIYFKVVEDATSS